MRSETDSHRGAWDVRSTMKRAIQNSAGGLENIRNHLHCQYKTQADTDRGEEAECESQKTAGWIYGRRGKTKHLSNLKNIRELCPSTTLSGELPVVGKNKFQVNR